MFVASIDTGGVLVRAALGRVGVSRTQKRQAVLLLSGSISRTMRLMKKNSPRMAHNRGLWPLRAAIDSRPQAVTENGRATH